MKHQPMIMLDLTKFEMMKKSGSEFNLAYGVGKAMDPLPNLREEELLYFCKEIEQIAGISLRSSKSDLIRTRLRSRIVEMGLKDYSEYRQYLENLQYDHAEWQNFINLLTTNKTDFFREPKHFDFMISEIIPTWLRTKAGAFRVWSAASSTGEEAYTLAMILDRHLPKDRSFQIHATDIDSDVISTAKNAVYSMDHCHEIPSEYQKSCLDFGKGPLKNWFRIKKNLKDRVSFYQHNLISSEQPCAEKFDLVLCRNVFIYFSQKKIELVCRKLHSMTKNHGYLFIGHSESLQGIKHSWTSIAPSIFQKRDT